MFNKLRYRWALRKYLINTALFIALTTRPPDPEEWGDEPHVKHAMGREVTYSEQWISMFRSKYLVEQSFLYHVPIPDKDDDWIQPRGAPERFLTVAAAYKLRSDILAMQKAQWEFWQSKITLCFSAIALVVALLAYFKK